MAQQESLALITLDIMMPDVDGWAFLRRLKKIPALRHVPVVIISILADRTKGFALGAAAVMQSPVTRKELYDSLVELGLSPISGDHTIKVLIVDDDPKAVELIAHRMRGLANPVLRAYSGEEAISIATQELPDLIVLDLMMPGIDGFQVVDALSANERTSHIPVVVVTAAEVSPEDVARLNGSVSSLLGKTGLDEKRLLSEVRRAMANRHVVA
jgi:CheY-like chemotaxis protein